MENDKLPQLYIEQHQDKDNITLDQIHSDCKHRDPKSTCPREQKLANSFNDLKKIIGGNAALRIYQGACSSFSCPEEVGINIEMNKDFQSNVPIVNIEHVDLYVLAHEFGHQAQITHLLSRYYSSTKRSKEANADYFAGVWIGIQLGKEHGIDIKGLSQIAFSLRGGGDGDNKYPYSEERKILLLRGIANPASQLLVQQKTEVIVSALNQDGLNDIWDASDASLNGDNNG